MAIGIHHSAIARISGIRQPIGDRQLFVTVSMAFVMHLLVLLAILGIAEAVDQLQTQTDDDNLENVVSDHKAQWVSIAQHIKDLEEILKTQKDLSKRLQLLAETRHERSNQQQCLGCERNRMYPWAEQPGPFQFQANCTHVGAHNSALNFNFEVCTMVLAGFICCMF